MNHTFHILALLYLCSWTVKDKHCLRKHSLHIYCTNMAAPMYISIFKLNIEASFDLNIRILSIDYILVICTCFFLAKNLIRFYVRLYKITLLKNICQPCCDRANNHEYAFALRSDCLIRTQEGTQWSPWLLVKL